MRHAAMLSICSLLQLVIQFGFQMQLARWFGATEEADALQAAMGPPLLLSMFLAGSISYVFVPNFLQHREQGGDARAFDYAASMLWLVGCLALLASIIGFLFAETLCRWWYPSMDPTRHALTVRLWRILIWTTLTGCLVSLLLSIHQSLQHFAIAGLQGVIGTGVTLLWIVLGPRSIESIAWGMLVGSIVAVLVQLPQSRACWIRGPGSPRLALTSLAMLMPFLLAMTYTRLDPIVDRIFATWLPAGALSHLGYANRIVTALLAVGTSSLSIVAFSSLATAAARNDLQQVSVHLGRSLRALLWVLVPLSFGLIFFAQPAIADLFERGSFVAEDTRVVSRLTQWLVGMFVGASLGELVSRTFYSLRDTWTPVIVGAIGLTIAAIAKGWFVPTYGADAIVIATSGYFLVASVALAGLLRGRIGGEFLRGLLWHGGLVVAATAFALGLAWGVRMWWPQSGIVIALPVAAIGYLASTWPMVRRRFDHPSALA
jgi:putative peptidoglycan lipid II flippase